MVSSLADMKPPEIDTTLQLHGALHDALKTHEEVLLVEPFMATGYCLRNSGILKPLNLRNPENPENPDSACAG